MKPYVPNAFYDGIENSSSSFLVVDVFFNLLYWGLNYLQTNIMKALTELSLKTKTGTVLL